MAIEPAAEAVLLDACVLYPAPIRDLLVQLASDQLYRAKWTDRIHDEWITAILRSRPDLTRGQLERTRGLMNRAVLDCLVEGYETLLPSLRLADPDDAHILAAAIHAGCSAIVTFNLSDFPSETVSRHGIEALHPDDFLLRLCERDAAAVIAAAAACRMRLRNPPLSSEEYLAVLGRSVPRTVEIRATVRRR